MQIVIGHLYSSLFSKKSVLANATDVISYSISILVKGFGVKEVAHGSNTSIFKGCVKVAPPIAVTWILYTRSSTKFEAYVRVCPMRLTFEESKAGPEIEYD